MRAARFIGGAVERDWRPIKTVVTVGYVGHGAQARSAESIAAALIARQWKNCTA